MSPEMMAKRHLLPLSGPQEPVSAAVATFVASVTVEAVVTGAIIGAVGAAITGGDILKGALLGGLGGALTSGMGGVMAGEAGAVAAEMPGSIEAVNGMDLASDLATKGATQTGTIGTSGLQNINQYGTAFPGEAAGAQMTPAVTNAPLQSTGSSVATAKTTGEIAANTAGAGTAAAQNTSIVQGAANNLAPTVTKGGTGLLSKAGDLVNKALSSPYGAAAAMQLGGAMLTGNAADKREEQQIAAAEARRKRTMTPINMTAEKWA